MQKFSITICILLFVLVTIIVLSADTPSTTRKVQFTNQNLVINNEGTEISNKDVEINLNKTEINNTKLATNEQNINFTNKNLNLDNSKSNFQNTNFTSQSSNFDNQNDHFQNNKFRNQSSNFDNQSSNFDNQNTRYNNSNINNQESKFDKQLANYERQQNKIKNIENSLKNRNINNQRTRSTQQNRYLVKNIDWNTWKSNFVNKIVEDSVNIRELDEYGIGSWFYYSFDVDSSGRIYNVKVSSPYILAEDKNKIANLIKSYAYTDITIFPANTKRTTANVNAIVLLGNTEKKSKPSDFNDTEKIRIKLN